MAPPYDQIARQYHEAEQRPIARFFKDPLFVYALNQVIFHNPSLLSGCALDVGCGPGAFTRILGSRGFNEVIGIDESHEGIGIARKVEKEQKLGIEFIVAELGTESFLEKINHKTFDLVTAVMVLQYADSEAKLDSMLSDIHKSLNDEGRVIAMIPNPDLGPSYNGPFGIRWGPIGDKNDLPIKIKARFKRYKGKGNCLFYNYWRPKQKYDAAFKRVGFVNELVPSVIPEEAKEAFSRRKITHLVKRPPYYLCLLRKEALYAPSV